MISDSDVAMEALVVPKVGVAMLHGGSSGVGSTKEWMEWGHKGKKKKKHFPSFLACICWSHKFFFF
jgi:hypothetical protein